MSQIEAGQLRLEEIDFDIRDVVQQVTTLFSGKLQEKGLQIHSHLPPLQECKARGDPLRWVFLFSWLLFSAMQTVAETMTNSPHGRSSATGFWHRSILGCSKVTLGHRLSDFGTLLALGYLMYDFTLLFHR